MSRHQKNLSRLASPAFLRRSASKSSLLLSILMAGTVTSFTWSPLRLAASAISRPSTSPQLALSPLRPLHNCVQPVLEAVPADSRVVVDINEVGFKRELTETLSRYQLIPISTKETHHGNYFTLSLHQPFGASPLTECTGFDLFLHTPND